MTAFDSLNNTENDRWLHLKRPNHSLIYYSANSVHKTGFRSTFVVALDELKATSQLACPSQEWHLIASRFGPTVVVIVAAAAVVVIAFVVYPSVQRRLHMLAANLVGLMRRLRRPFSRCTPACDCTDYGLALCLSINRLPEFPSWVTFTSARA